MSGILIIAEHDGTRLNRSTAKCVTCAQSIGPDSIDIVVFSDQCAAIAEQAAALSGVAQVVTVERPENAHQLAAQLAPRDLHGSEPLARQLLVGVALA